MVRRAILRVAFLAEVVLAMVSNILRQWALDSEVTGVARRPLFKHVIDAAGFFKMSLRNAETGANLLAMFRSRCPGHNVGAAQRTAAAGLRPPPSTPL